MNMMNELPHVKRLNDKYSLFAYVIEGMCWYLRGADDDDCDDVL
jgi:hypothetical protein